MKSHLTFPFLDLMLSADSRRYSTIPGIEIIQEEAAAYVAGDKSPEDTAAIIQNRVSIMLGEQS